jgi:hypothetical protein
VTSLSVSAAVRSRTAGIVTPTALLRLVTAVRLVPNASGAPASPVARARTSPTFSSANASQLSSSAGSSGSSAVVCGTCSSEVDVATVTGVDAARPRSTSRAAAAPSRSVRQML